MSIDASTMTSPRQRPVKRMLAVGLLALCLGVLAPLNGHEFWLQPQRYQFQTGEAIRVRFRVGEGFDGINWTGARPQAGQLKLYWKNYEDDLRNLLGDSIPGDSLSLQFFDEGTVTLAFESTDKFIRLRADSFLTYLEEDGIRNAIEYRAAHGETDSAGREFYRRSVKTIVQVGAAIENSCTKPTSLPLDIIPLVNPYALKKGQSLPVKIQFKGEALPHYRVKTWHRLNGKTQMQDLETDSIGQLRIPISLAGQWMVSTVRMERLVSDSANWRSYWGSLTFGYN